MKCAEEAHACMIALKQLHVDCPTVALCMMVIWPYMGITHGHMTKYGCMLIAQLWPPMLTMIPTGGSHTGAYDHIWHGPLSYTHIWAYHMAM